jgi:predicted Zn finger-like uncharacterized protein
LLRVAGNNAIPSNSMRLTCPQCHTEYEVPDAALAGRARTLRCADCGAKFKAPALPEAVVAAPELALEIPPHEDIAEEEAVQEEIAAEPEASFEPVTEALEPAIAETEPETIPAEAVAPLSATRTIPVPPKPAPPAAPKPNRALGVSILLLLLLIAIVLAEHRAIGHAWPPSLRLFNALGLH